MKKRNILAIIPARGGSKGIPGKNARSFAGKPLVAHAIQGAKGAPSVDRIIVSTDSQEIARIAKKAGAEVPFLRPARLSGSASNVIDTVIHLLDILREDEGYEPSHVLLLQPTSPLRTSEDIEQAVHLFERRRADSLVSLCRTENILLTKDSLDRVTILNTDALSSPNRQELPRYFKLDGSMIYFVKTSLLLKEHSFLAGRLIGYEVERWRTVDLDEPQDWVAGEIIFAHKDTIAKRLRRFK